MELSDVRRLIGDDEVAPAIIHALEVQAEFSVARELLVDLQREVDALAAEMRTIAGRTLAEVPPDKQDTAAAGLYWLLLGEDIRPAYDLHPEWQNKYARYMRQLPTGVCSVCAGPILVGSRRYAEEDLQAGETRCHHCRAGTYQRCPSWPRLSFDRAVELANTDYETYRHTPEWHDIAAAMYEYADYRCADCGLGDVELHTHHVSYERLGHEVPDDLVVLCPDCHRKRHGK